MCQGQTDINPKASVEHQDCSFLRLKDGLIDEINCNEMGLDYVCMHDGMDKVRFV